MVITQSLGVLEDRTIYLSLTISLLGLTAPRFHLRFAARGRHITAGAVCNVKIRLAYRCTSLCDDKEQCLHFKFPTFPLLMQGVPHIIVEHGEILFGVTSCG